jgi:hypothetical protein
VRGAIYGLLFGVLLGLDGLLLGVVPSDSPVIAVLPLLGLIGGLVLGLTTPLKRPAPSGFHR